MLTNINLELEAELKAACDKLQSAANNLENAKREFAQADHEHKVLCVKLDGMGYFPVVDSEDTKVLGLNNKGLTLLEMLIAIVLMGIVGMGMNSMLIGQIKVSKKITTKLEGATDRALAAFNANPAVAPGADQRTYLAGLNVCTKLNGADRVVNGATVQWYAKRTDSRVVGFYKNSSNCSSGYIGTLTAQTNPTYDDDVTNTFWNVSGEGNSLRIWVHKLNLPNAN